MVHAIARLRGLRASYINPEMLSPLFLRHRIAGIIQPRRACRPAPAAYIHGCVRPYTTAGATTHSLIGRQLLFALVYTELLVQRASLCYYVTMAEVRWFGVLPLSDGLCLAEQKAGPIKGKCAD
jgi:hypothetical protein